MIQGATEVTMVLIALAAALQLMGVLLVAVILAVIVLVILSGVEIPWTARSGLALSVSAAADSIGDDDEEEILQVGFKEWINDLWVFEISALSLLYLHGWLVCGRVYHGHILAVRWNIRHRSQAGYSQRIVNTWTIPLSFQSTGKEWTGKEERERKSELGGDWSQEQ